MAAAAGRPEGFCKRLALQISSEGNLGATPGSVVADQLTLGGGVANGKLKTTANLSLGANRGVTLGTLGGTFDTDPGTTLTINGVIKGTTLTKTGTGTLDLTGANTYTGGTAVSNGTLKVNGSAVGLITVMSGATFGGSGTVSNLTMNPVSTYAPGNSPGTNTVTGQLTLNGDTNVFELVSASTHDQTVITSTGGLTLTNAPILQLALTTFTGTAGDKFLLFDNQFATTPFDHQSDFFLDDSYYGGLQQLTNQMAFFAVGGGSVTNEFRIFYDANGLTPDGSGNDILLTVIPEPASVNLLVMLGAAYVMRRRLHRKKSRWNI